MKKIQILLFSIFILSSVAYSQTQSPEERALAQTETMKVELALTSVQETSVYDVNFGIIIKNDQIKNSTYPEDQKKQIIQQNNEARKLMLKNILTVDQYSKLELRLKERQEVKKEKQIKN
jgi:hypothetical protein